MEHSIEIRDIRAVGIVPYLTWFNDVPDRKRVDSEAVESIIINIMQGTYHGLLGILNGKPVGLLIYHMITNSCIDFKFLYGPKKMTRFYIALMEYFNKYSIKSFGFESIHEPKLWNRLYPNRIKKIRSTYSFDVAGMFLSGADNG